MNAHGCPIRSYLPGEEHPSFLKAWWIYLSTSLVFQYALLALHRCGSWIWRPLGNHNQQRFVVLTAPRTGSTFLVDQLNRMHPDLQCRGEILNHRYAVYGDFSKRPAWRLGIHIRATLTSWPRNLWRVFTASKRIVGAKIFLNHLEMHGVTIKWLLDQLEGGSLPPRVIYLYRSNLLESYVSLAIAFKTDVWYSTRSSEPVAIRLDM
jgi:hypothetical protein